jgi:hypothetical protein
MDHIQGYSHRHLTDVTVVKMSNAANRTNVLLELQSTHMDSWIKCNRNPQTRPTFKKYKPLSLHELDNYIALLHSPTQQEIYAFGRTKIVENHEELLKWDKWPDIGPSAIGAAFPHETSTGEIMPWTQNAVPLSCSIRLGTSQPRISDWKSEFLSSTLIEGPSASVRSLTKVTLALDPHPCK